MGPILYRPGKEFAGLEDYVGKSVVVHVLAKYLTTKNQQVGLLIPIARTSANSIVLLTGYRSQFVGVRFLYGRLGCGSKCV